MLNHSYYNSPPVLLHFLFLYEIIFPPLMYNFPSRYIYIFLVELEAVTSVDIRLKSTRYRNITFTHIKAKDEIHKCLLIYLSEPLCLADHVLLWKYTVVEDGISNFREGSWFSIARNHTHKQTNFFLSHTQTHTERKAPFLVLSDG